MSTAQLRLVLPMPERRVRSRQLPDEEVINVTVAADDRVLLSVPEAAHRLGIGRSFLYELIAGGKIETLTIGRLRKISVQALTEFVERQRQGLSDV